MKKILYVLALFFLLLLPHPTFGIEPDESGLKTGGELAVPVVVLSLQEAEASVGLTEAKVLREVEFRLLRHGIIPADREVAHMLGWYLGVDILILGSEITERRLLYVGLSVVHSLTEATSYIERAV